ncbi:unnamed protein product [Moneuplotes crassus]|uniref:Uncharacterized protein n=1 Tax=Euplotes crassus TaxID=5936 RepID=A0AAD1XAA2_EUPCR|nr:unnamed protein product [Moneuplotes crassus]
MLSRAFGSSRGCIKRVFTRKTALPQGITAMPHRVSRRFHKISLLNKNVTSCFRDSQIIFSSMNKYYLSTGIDSRSEISEIMSQFSSKSKSLNVQEIVTIMDKIICVNAKPEELESYKSSFDQIASAALEKIHEITSGAEALVYLRFFSEKYDPCDETLSKLDSMSLNLPGSSTETILDILESLNNNNRLSQEICIEAAQELKRRISKMQLKDIPVASSLICSCQLHDDKFVEALEERLFDICLAGEVYDMPLDEFVLLCTVISEFELPYKIFLEDARDFAMSKLEEFTPEQLSTVVSTYLVFCDDTKLANHAEKRIMKIRRRLTVEECLSLMQTYILYDSSEEIWTTFDITIGRNMRKVQDFQVLMILNLFSKAPYHIRRLFKAFVEKIKTTDFELKDLASIARIYGETGYNDDDIYQYLDHALSDQIKDMSDGSVVSTLIGFLNPEIDSKFEILPKLESHIQEIMPKIKLHNVATLLLRYGQLSEGSEEMKNVCTNRIVEIFTSEITNSEDVSALELVLTMYSFNISKVDAKCYYPILNHLVAKKEEFDLERLDEIHSMLMKFHEDSMFSYPILQFKYERDKYFENGIKKQIYE